MSRSDTLPAARIVLRLVYAVLAVLLLVIAVNLPLFDEQPDEELLAALEQIPMPAAEENAWIALWGFRAVEGVDVIEAGRALRARHEEKVAKGLGHTLDEDDYTDILGNGDPGFADIDSWLQQVETCTPRATQGCLEKYISQLAALGRPDRLELLTRRWQSLISMPAFTAQQMDSPEDSLPDYMQLIRVSDIALARLASEDDLEFLVMLDQDSRFWRRVLDGDNTLVAKMVAVAMLWRDTQYLSAYMAGADESADLNMAARIAAPLTDQELDISEAWRYEMRIGLNSLNPDQTSWLQRLFMQEQATDNAVFRYTWQPLMALSRLSPAELYSYVSEKTAAGEKPMTCCSTAANTSLFSPAFFYNPAGKLLLAGDFDLGQMNLEDYMERVFDLQGYLRLVNIQLRMLETGIASPVTLLDEAEFANPHTGNPMEWNASSRELSFECRGLGTYCTISL